MPGLIWNTMMSMSGGWFFLVASEAILVGDLHVALPGIGSYVARAIEDHNLGAVGWAIIAMTVTIVIYDQLLFRPLVAWADKFRYEQTAAQTLPGSWVLALFRRTRILKPAGECVGTMLQTVARARLAVPSFVWPFEHSLRSSRLLDIVWYGGILLGIAYAGWILSRYVGSELSWTDISDVLEHMPIRLSVARVSKVSFAFAFGYGFEKRGDGFPKPLDAARLCFA
jgi:NitT/TauT family transport system permease protein